jgi:hypothetical protein
MPLRFRSRFHFAAATVLLAGLTGCASWSVWPDAKDEPAARPDPAAALNRVKRSIELESRFVQIQFDANDPDHLQSIWQWVDETVIPQPTRTVLHRNGLRAGRAVQPQRLLTKLETLQQSRSKDVVDQFLSSAAVSSPQTEGKKTIPMRLGKRYELPVRLPLEGDHVVMVHRQPQPMGRTLRDPQFLFAITPLAGTAPASIRLRLRPEVQHGDMHQNWVKGEAALRIDVRRQSWSLSEMEFELDGGEGDLFVISETASRRGLGKSMLGGEDVDLMEEQTVLLLRIENVPTPADKL